MRVERIEILRSPGISPGFEVNDFGEGLTVILGRNESGKSTLAATIRALLWPDRHDTLQARGTFAVHDQSFESFVDLRGGGWQGDAPPMPDRSASRGLVVGIGDLWREDNHHKSIREAMSRELQGGYDLAAILRPLEPKAPTAPMQKLNKARHTLEAARAEAQAILAQEARLPALRKRVALLGETSGSQSRVEAAMTRLDRLASVATDEQQLAQLPTGALRVSGKEGQDVVAFQRSIDQSKSRVEQEARGAHAAQAAIEALGLPEGGIAPGDLELLGRFVQDGESLRVQIEQACQHENAARAAAEALAVGGSPMDASTLAELDGLLLEVQHARERMSRDVIAAEQQEQPTRKTNHGLGAALLLATLATTIAAGFTGAWIALAGALVSLGLAGCGLWRAAAIDDGSSRQAQDQLQEQAARSTRAYEQSLEALRSIAGVDEEVTSTLSLVVAAKRTERADDATRSVLAARATVESLEEQLAMVTQRAAEPLSRCGLEACGNTDGLVRAFADAKDKAAEHDRLVREMRDAEARGADEQTRLTQTRQDYERFLSRLGLTEDRLDELKLWLHHRERAQALADRVRESKAVVSSIESTLEGSPKLLQLDAAALQDQLSKCKQAGSERDRLQSEIGDIEGAVRRQRHSADVQAAIGDVEQAAAAVAEARDLECAKAVRRMILGQASSGVKRDDMPVLVREADALLARFTSNAYSLRVDDAGEPSLYDALNGLEKASAQLSTGTRAQVMLALRIAGVREAERRAGSGPLPLVLDEPLATTDAGRFEAVANAMMELAHDGRQIVYLTCEPAHVRALESTAEKAGTSVTRLDLDAIRRRKGLEVTPKHALVAPTPPPSPRAMSRADYLNARGVPPLDPWAPAEAMDVYHLLADDLGLVHELGQRGIRTVGQVLDQRERDRSGFRWPAAAESALLACRLVGAWRRGRARPFTAVDLEASGAAGAFFDRFTELLTDLRGSAGDFIRAVEARKDDRCKGFRAEKARVLRAYMESNGFLPEASPLDRAGAISAALGEGRDGSNEDADRRTMVANRLLDLFEAAQIHNHEAQAASEA